MRTYRWRCARAPDRRSALPDRSGPRVSGATRPQPVCPRGSCSSVSPRKAGCPSCRGYPAPRIRQAQPTATGLEGLSAAVRAPLPRAAKEKFTLLDAARSMDGFPRAVVHRRFAVRLSSFVIRFLGLSGIGRDFAQGDGWLTPSIRVKVLQKALFNCCFVVRPSHSDVSSHPHICENSR